MRRFLSEFSPGLPAMPGRVGSAQWLAVALLGFIAALLSACQTTPGTLLPASLPATLPASTNSSVSVKKSGQLETHKLEYGVDQRVVVETVKPGLRNLALDADLTVLGSKASVLFRLSDDALSAVPVHEFKERINAIHVMLDGAIVVATDSDHWDPETPCEVYISRDGGHSFDMVRRFTGGSALWWSISSDSHGTLYVGEYGPRGRGTSKSVFSTSDHGKTWSKAFSAKNEDGLHIHRVAVDPFTDDLWVSTGDGRRHRGIYRRRYGTNRFVKLVDSQATAIAFTHNAVWFGEDRPRRPGVSRFDRATGRTKQVLNLDRYENAGGSIYSMVVDDAGVIYAPAMQYPDQTHRALLWANHRGRWSPLTGAPVRDNGASGFETIAGPDREGWIYVTGFRVRHAVSVP